MIPYIENIIIVHMMFSHAPVVLGCAVLTRVFLYPLQERGHAYYAGMTKDQFKKMQEFIASRSSNKPPSKL